jgi:tripartite-type tricarboxylate transporter receptor subunit TctC
MTSIRNRIALMPGIAATALIVLVAGPAAAAEFPNKPVRLTVAYPPGGSTDVGARIVAAIAEKQFGQPIVVVNKGGAGGQVGWTELSRQRPDGYSIGFINLPAFNTVILDPERKAAFKADDVVPVINQVLDPGIIWVKSDSPYKTFKDLVAAARKAPNKISAGTTGILSDDHLAILMVEEAAPGAVFRVVHFEGGAPQLTAVLGGHLDVAFDNVGTVFRRIRSGELRALAVMDTQRSRFIPDVPTMPELGFPTVISSSTRGIAAPRGTPAPVVKKLAQVLKQAMDDPEHVKKMDEAGLTLRIMIGEEYAKYYRELHAKAAKYTEWARNRPHK